MANEKRCPDEIAVSARLGVGLTFRARSGHPGVTSRLSALLSGCPPLRNEVYASDRLEKQWKGPGSICSRA